MAAACTLDHVANAKIVTLCTATIALTAFALARPIESTRTHMLFLAAAVLCFGVLLVAVRSRPAHTVLMVAAAIQLGMAVAFPPANSDDVWAYAFHGRVAAVHGENPAITPPSAFPDDPWLDRVRPIWRDDGTVYGPVFTGLAAGVAKLSPNSFTTARVLFQGSAALAIAVLLMILWRQRRPAWTLAVAGLNPLIAVIVVNGAHNDVIAGVGVLIGALLLQQSRHISAGATLGLSAMVKLSAAVPAGLFVVLLLKSRKFRPAAIVAIGGSTLVGFGYWIAGGRAILRPLFRASENVAFSVWEAPFQLARLQVAKGARLAVADQVPAPKWYVLISLLIPVLVAVFGRWTSPLAAVGAGTLAWYLLAPYSLPWYPALFIPLIVDAGRGRLVALTFGVMVAHSAIYLASLAPSWRGSAWLRFVELRVTYDVLGVALATLMVMFVAARYWRPGKLSASARNGVAGQDCVNHGYESASPATRS